MQFSCLEKGHVFSDKEIEERKYNADAIHIFMADVARKCGYAIAIHGSKVRDIDLVAVPWTSEASSMNMLLITIISTMQLVMIGGITDKDHGRKAVALFDLDRPTQQIDLSIFPKRVHYECNAITSII